MVLSHYEVNCFFIYRSACNGNLFPNFWMTVLGILFITLPVVAAEWKGTLFLFSLQFIQTSIFIWNYQKDLGEKLFFKKILKRTVWKWNECHIQNFFKRSLLENIWIMTNDFNIIVLKENSNKLIVNIFYSLILEKILSKRVSSLTNWFLGLVITQYTLMKRKIWFCYITRFNKVIVVA